MDNQQIYDLTVENQIKFIRYANQKVGEALKLIDESDKEIANWVMTVDWDRPNVAGLEKIVARHHSLTTQFVQETMDEIALMAVAIEVAALANKSVNVIQPAKVTILDAVRTRIFGGAPMIDWITQHNRGDASRLVRTFREQRLRSPQRNAMLTSLIGSARRQRLNGARGTTRRGLETLIRTAVTHAVNSGRQTVHMANPKIVRAVQWASVLDTRTSEVCRSLDQKTFKVGEGPRPPAHPNCRSVVVPLFWVSKRYVRENWDEWFARQPDEVKKEAVGAKRFRLYKDGKVKPGEFRNAAGERYTLKELQDKMPEAFKRAGL